MPQGFRTWWHGLRVRYFFGDVGVLFERHQKAAGEGRPIAAHDLAGFSEAERLLELPSQACPYEQALPLLRRSVNRTIRHFERGLLWRMGAIHFVDVLMSLAGALCSMGILWLFEAQLPPVLADHKVSLALLLAVLVFLLNVGSTALHCRKIDWEMLLAYRIRVLLARYVFSHALATSADTRRAFSGGDLVSFAAQDAKHIGQFYAHGFVDLFVLGAASGVLLTIMIGLFGKAAVVGFIVFLGHLPLVVYFSRLSRRKNARLMERTSSRLALISEWILGMRLVRYFGWGKAFISGVQERSLAEFRELRDLHVQYSVAFALSTGWWMLVALSTLGAMFWLGTTPTVSATFGVVWLSARLGALVNPLPWFVSEGAMARVSDRRLREFFALPGLEELAPGKCKVMPPPVEVAAVTRVGFELRDVVVSFSQGEQPAALVIECLDIQAGRSLAIVGAVGSGKTLLENVLLGELVPQSGTVDVLIWWRDGESEQQCRIPLYSPDGLRFVRELVGFVPQHNVVLSASVRENVALDLALARASGGPTETSESWGSDARIADALARAQLEQDLKTFPDGLATLIGERGISLSGGQRQRLAIARAYFLERPVVVLDDPLSAVDRETEAALCETIFGQGAGLGHGPGPGGGQAVGRTLVVSTHRHRCVALCDDAVLLENGRVTCAGPVAELLQTPSPLALWLSSHEDT